MAHFWGYLRKFNRVIGVNGKLESAHSFASVVIVWIWSWQHFIATVWRAAFELFFCGNLKYLPTPMTACEMKPGDWFERQSKKIHPLIRFYSDGLRFETHWIIPLFYYQHLSYTIILAASIVPYGGFNKYPSESLTSVPAYERQIWK